MIYPQASHQAPTMSSSQKTSPRPRHKNLSISPIKSGPSAKNKRNFAKTSGAERCRGRCRVEWSERHVKEGLVLVQESQLARVVKTGPISEHYEIDPKPFASGQWARVYKCRSRSTGTMYAAKYSSRTRFNADCSAELRHEIALLSLCSQSSRVVRLHDVYETPKEIILVMEYAPGGDLQTLIDGDLVPLEGDVVHFVRQLVEGLAYLHERNIAHLDIKPQNLVMMGSFPECEVKLCDFEISRVILEGTEVREILGTPDYVAPEILHYEPITLAADMWSLGVTTYVLLTGFSPFGGETDQETFQNISLGEVDFPEELFEDVSAQAKDFVAKLLVLDPSARMTAKQCLRHEWLRGAPTQASPHLRRYLSKSREVLLERVVSRENLRRAALLSQASSNANLSEPHRNYQHLNCNLSQSEMCLSYGLTGSQGSLPGSEGFVSPADSRSSLNSSQTSLAKSQSCLLNKEQTQGLLSQAQSRSQANLNHGVSRGLLSRMRGFNQVQSQACLLNDNKTIMKEMLSPFLGRSREKLYGLKCLSKSQGVLDIYRSLESLKKRKKNPQRARTEDMLPIFKQLSAGIADSRSSLGSVTFGNNTDTKSNPDTGIADKNDVDVNENIRLANGVPMIEKTCSKNTDTTGDRTQSKLNGEAAKNDLKEESLKKCREKDSGKPSERKLLEVPKSPIPESEENLDSLQSIESDTLTEDSDETAPHGGSPTLKQPSQRQHSDISSLSNNSGNSDEKEEHSDSENDEPKYTVAQLVSAFNKHQEVASKTSLEAIMSEKRINEVTFPTGPKALRLFIPDINITESTIVRRKTSYKPRKNWEELRKRNEKNEGILKSLDNDFGHDEEEEEDNDGNERLNKKDSEEEEFQKTEDKDWTSFERFVGEPDELRENHDTTINEKYKQCVDGAKAMRVEKDQGRDKTCAISQNERVAKYIYPGITSKKNEQEPKKKCTQMDNSVNLKDILLKVDHFETTPKENLENLRKRTSIAKIILNDTALSLEGDANNNGSSSTLKTETNVNSCPEEEKISLDVPPSFVRSSSLSSESSCPTSSSVQSESSWEDVRTTRNLEKEDSRFKRSSSVWENQKPTDSRSRSSANLEDRKVWGKVCTGTYTRAMERFNGKGVEGSRKSQILTNVQQTTEKIRRKSSPAMPQYLDS